MRFAVAALATACAFALGADASQFNSALFSEEIPSEVMMQDMFTSYMKQYNKAYTHEEFFPRYNQFKAAVEYIRVHNTSNESYTLGINKFADLSTEEWASMYLGYKPRVRHGHREEHVSTEAAPTKIDWRTQNAVTPVKDQGQCGSCWAFSAVSSLESAWFLAGNTLTQFSEQQLVDCSTANAGCDGGNMDPAFAYIEKNGICTETAYPYKAVDGTCKKTCTSVGSLSGYKDITGATIKAKETNLMNAVGTVGPVSIAIEADQKVFQFYTSGVLTSAACGTSLDHGVTIVGYDLTAVTPYWIVKNSWGADWGESGYVRLGYGIDECGLATDASYPTV